MDELILGPIIGGLSHERALLWGKTNPQDGDAILHAWIGEKSDLSDAELRGTSWPLSSDQGFAGVAPVFELKPETTYTYALTLSNKPPQKGEGPLENGKYPSFRTFPSPRNPVSFNFAFGSCFRPEDEDGGGIFKKLEERRTADQLRFILLIGDQIYADDFVTNSIHKVAETLEEYRTVYEYVWNRKHFRELLFNLPAFMTLDDHEVDDDWRWLDKNRGKPYIPVWDSYQRIFRYKRPRSEGMLTMKRVQAALQAYWEHQGMHAPSAIRTLEIDQKGRYMLQKEDPGSLAYKFEYGAAAFFVLDTRTMRVRDRWWRELIFRTERTMLGEEQWKDLEDWLLEVKDKYPVKFLISSCSLLYYSRFDIPRDRWSGYKKERERLLKFIAEHEIEGLYILSGDVHIGHAIHAEVKSPRGRLISLWEFCSSPFEQEASQIMRRTRKEIDSEFLVRQDLKFDIDAHNFGVVGVSMEDPLNPEVTYRLYYDDMVIGIDTKV